MKTFSLPNGKDRKKEKRREERKRKKREKRKGKEGRKRKGEKEGGRKEEREREREREDGRKQESKQVRKEVLPNTSGSGRLTFLLGRASPGQQEARAERDEPRVSWAKAHLMAQG